MPRTRENTAYAQRSIKEYNHARKLLYKYLKKRHDPDAVIEMIETVIENMTNKQSKIIGYTLNAAFKAGTKEGDKIISHARITAATATVGFDLSKISDTHGNKIVKDTIGHIGKYNTQLSKQLTLEYKALLADNRLMNSLSKNGWTPWLDKALEKRGLSKAVIALAKGQASTAKMINILEIQGMKAGRHPREVSKMLIPHVQRYFGPNGVEINNVGKYRKALKVDASGNYSYVKKLITRPYRATPKSYASIIARSSMHSAHLEGRFQSLEKTHLVDYYVSQSILDARTCAKCAQMHGVRISKEEGPLYHGNCMCNMKPIWKKDSGLKNKDPSFYENQRDTHFLKEHDLREFNKKMPKGEKVTFSSLLPEDAITETLPNKEAMLEIRKAILK